MPSSNPSYNSAFTMQALVCEGGETALVRVPRPTLHRPSDVIVRVVASGICRTDRYVATGKIPISGPITLGHELAGVVVDKGHAVENLGLGERVTAYPLHPCGSCDGCTSSTSPALRCYYPKSLGIDAHGCFAEFISLPAASVLPVPDSLSPMQAAYTEPLAACLAIFEAGISPEDRGGVIGSNRFATLAQNLLDARGFETVSFQCDEVEECSLDYAIETGMEEKSIETIVRALRPGGTLILKSRSTAKLPIPVRALVAKNIRVQAVRYGCFSEAMSLLAQDTSCLQALHFRGFSLSEYRDSLLSSTQDAAASELEKRFFLFSDGWP